MRSNEILKVKAEAHTNHLIAKLNETESEALGIIAKSEGKINLLKKEIEACNSKKEALRKSFQELNNADDNTWDIANQKFIESVESLEDKNVFKNKTDEWFGNIRDVATKLKIGVKEKIYQM